VLKGWKEYRSPRGDYSLRYPGSWQQKGSGSKDEDQNFSPGLDPSTGPVWFTINTRTEDEVRTINGDPDCFHYSVSNSIYHPAGPFKLGDQQALRFSLSTPAGYPGESAFGLAVNTKAGARCFRFEFVSPTKADWTRSEQTALRILSTVRFTSE
jgi:hypothetical protein